MRKMVLAVVLMVGGCAGRPLGGDEPVVAADATCAVSMTSPTLLAGADDQLPLCEQLNQGGFLMVYFTGGGVTVMADIKKGAALPGNTYDLGAGAALLSDGEGRSCSGALTWESDVPDWAVSVDATCPGGVDVRAAWHGHSTTPET